MSSSFDFGSAIGGIGGALIGALASVGSAHKQFKYQSALQKQAAKLNYTYGLKQAKQLTQYNATQNPTFTRQGLEKAGYNPMLAVSNGMSSVANASSGFTSAGQATSPDYAGGIASGISSALDFKRLDNETKQTEANVDLSKSQGRKAVAEAINTEIRNPYVSKQEEAQLGKIGAETDKLIRETNFFDQLADNMEAERRLQEMGINLGYQSSIYGANKSFEGTVYNSNTLAETMRGTRTDRLPFGFGSTYYDMRYKDNRMRVEDSNDRKYWRNYY